MRKFIKKFSYRVPNPASAYNPGGGIVYVKPGDFIVFNETYQDGSKVERIGRVMDQALFDGMGNKLRKHLRVLVPSADFHFGYPRIIDLNDIVGVRQSGDFARFFFAESMPDPDTIQKMSDYGSLSDNYVKADLARRIK